MSNRVRTCPVCEHRQLRDDPTRHVCAGVLRETLRQTRDALSLAQARLFVIAETVEHADPVAGVRLLKRDHADAWHWAEAAYGRGYRHGLHLARALLRRLAKRLPFGAWLMRSESAVLASEIDMKTMVKGDE